MFRQSPFNVPHNTGQSIGMVDSMSSEGLHHLRIYRVDAATKGLPVIGSTDTYITVDGVRVGAKSPVLVLPTSSTDTNVGICYPDPKRAVQLIDKPMIPQSVVYVEGGTLNGHAMYMLETQWGSSRQLVKIPAPVFPVP